MVQLLHLMIKICLVFIIGIVVSFSFSQIKNGPLSLPRITFCSFKRHQAWVLYSNRFRSLCLKISEKFLISKGSHFSTRQKIRQTWFTFKLFRSKLLSFWRYREILKIPTFNCTKKSWNFVYILVIWYETPFIFTIFRRKF